MAAAGLARTGESKDKIDETENTSTVHDSFVMVAFMDCFLWFSCFLTFLVLFWRVIILPQANVSCFHVQFFWIVFP